MKAHLKLGEILRLGGQTLDGPEAHTHLGGNFLLGFARLEHAQGKRFLFLREMSFAVGVSCPNHRQTWVGNLQSA